MTVKQKTSIIQTLKQTRLKTIKQYYKMYFKSQKPSLMICQLKNVVCFMGSFKTVNAGARCYIHWQIHSDGPLIPTALFVVTRSR